MLSSPATKGHNIRDCVTAETVAAMDSTCDLTCSVESRDHIAICIENLGIDIDFDAAHRVVHFCDAMQRIVRTAIELLVEDSTPKAVIPAFQTGVIVVDSRLQNCWIHTKNRRQFFHGFSLCAVNVVNNVLDDKALLVNPIKAAVRIQPFFLD